MTALLIDIDGVLYEGERPVPGAAEAIYWIQDKAIPHLFLTNTTSRPRRALVRTGKFRPEDLAGDIRPEFVLDSIAELPQRWAEIAGSLKNA